MYAPFSFTIKKNEDTLKKEREEIRANAIPYFEYDSDVEGIVSENFRSNLEMKYIDSLYKTPERTVERLGVSFIAETYKNGVTDEIHSYDGDKLIYLKMETK